MPIFPSIQIIRTDQSYQFYVTSEKQTIAESSSLLNALIDVLSAYFAFDMAYPTKLYPLLIFFQHHVLDLTDEQKKPNNVTILYSSLVRQIQ